MHLYTPHITKSHSRFWQQDIPDEERHGHDAVCLVKQFISSTQLSQQPLLILPFHNLEKLKSSKPTQVLPTKEFNEKSLNEFRKTAGKIEQSPFDLVEGSNYLRTLCDRSEKGEYLHPLPLRVYDLRQDPFQCQQELVQEGVSDGFNDFAPGPPKRMEVKAARPNFPKENALGPNGVPEEHQPPADSIAAAAAAGAAIAPAMVLPANVESEHGEGVVQPGPNRLGAKPKALATRKPGDGKDDFFSAPKAKAKGRPPKAKVIKTAVKLAPKRPVSKAKAKAASKIPKAMVTVPDSDAIGGAGPKTAKPNKATAKAKAIVAKAKATSKPKAKASPKVRKNAPTRPGYKGCSKCRQGGCAKCRLPSSDV